jgi:hypothetical protein
MKEKGILKVEYEPGEEMRSDMFTKNLPGPIFMKHKSHFVGDVNELKLDPAATHRARESAGSGKYEMEKTRDDAICDHAKLDDVDESVRAKVLLLPNTTATMGFMCEID